MYIVHLDYSLLIKTAVRKFRSSEERAAGWSDFERKNVTLSLFCQIVVGPEFLNFTF